VNGPPLSALVAGFVAVLVGFTSSVVIVFQAAAALGATPAPLGKVALPPGVKLVEVAGFVACVKGPSVDVNNQRTFA
jgi:predicted benzoate:H+ symporter BenE